MKNLKRILALLGIIVLVGMYVLTFVASIMHSEYTHNLFMGAFYSTIFVPIMLYGYLLIYKTFKKEKEDDTEEK